MKRTLIKIYLVLLLFPSVKIYAQETIMTDVSYAYLQKLINVAKQNNPQVKIKQRQVTVSQNSYKLSKVAWFDALSFSYVYNPLNTVTVATVNPNSTGGTGTTGAGSSTGNTSLFAGGYNVSLTLNIGTLFKNPLDTKSAKENYNIALLEQDSYNLSVEAEVKRRYFTYLQQMATLRLKTKTAQDVENLLTESKHQFEKGSETLDAYIKATTAFSDISQFKIDAEIAVLSAKAALEEVIGKKLEEVK